MSTSTMQSGVVQHTLLKLIVWIALEAIQLEKQTAQSNSMSLWTCATQTSGHTSCMQRSNLTHTC